jgi:uncharacterized protein (TIGR03437 family)
MKMCLRIFTILSLSAILCGQDWPAPSSATIRARQEWFYSQREFPLGYIPAGARANAIRELRRIDGIARQQRKGPVTASAGKNANAAAAMDSATWTLIGPRPTGAGSTSVTSGRVTAIAIDPRNSNVLYIGAAEGGVWKTTDGGLNWKPLTDDQVSLATGAIALDPQNPDTVYVGTGEENFAGDSYYGAGILKSTDGGATWTNIVGPFLRDRIGSVAVSPSITGLVLCAAQSGVWRSTDGGATWSRTLTGTGTSLLFDPRDGNSVFAALGNTSGSSSNGVYHSSDGGATWLKLPGLSSPTVANIGRIQLAMAPSQPSTMYGQVQNSSAAAHGNLLGIWKTTDGGLTWTQLPIPNSLSWGDQLWYDTAIAVSPVNPDVVYSGATPIFRSLNGGATWSSPSPLGPNLQRIHVDQHAFAFTPDGSKLYIGNDGGIYYTTDITATSINWNELNDTLATTQFYPGMSIDAANVSSAIAGTQDNGTQRYDGNLSWTGVTCGDGGFTAVDFSAPQLAYSACQDIAIQRTATLSGNSSWVPASYGIDQTDATQFISPFMIDPSNPQTLYFGTYRLWQSQDSGGKWRAVSPRLGGQLGTLKTIAVAPSDSNTVYVGTNDAFVKVTNDIQDGPNAVWRDRSAGLPLRTVTHIAVDPVDPGTAYVTFSGFALGSALSGHVYKTSSGGVTWTDISGNLPDIPANDLVIDPDLAQTLYIATDAGVMVSTDGGATWSSLGQGLPNVVVTSLVMQRKSRLLRAATHGRSVWDILVPLGSGGSQQPVISSINPSTANAGSSDLTISVTGSGFGSTTVIRWNGQNLSTTFVDATHLTAKIPASDLALTGRASLTAFTASSGAGVSNAVGFNVGPAPQATAQGFVSLVYTLGGNVLGKGTLASLYGSNLAPQTAIADLGGTWPFTLGGVTLTLAGGPLPLYYVSPDVVVFQLPFFTGAGPIRTSLVLTSGTQSTTINVTLQAYSPALVTTSIDGSGQARTVVALTGQTAAPVGAFPNSRPAHIGEYVSIYATGLGDVTNRPALGEPSPSSPLARNVVNPTVTIGNVPVTDIQFAGLAPTLVGVWVVNARVPPGTPVGDAIPITLSIGGFTSNTGTIAVDAAPTP